MASRVIKGFDKNKKRKNSFKGFFPFLIQAGVWPLCSRFSSTTRRKREDPCSGIRTARHECSSRRFLKLQNGWFMLFKIMILNIGRIIGIGKIFSRSFAKWDLVCLRTIAIALTLTLTQEWKPIAYRTGTASEARKARAFWQRDRWISRPWTQTGLW